LFSHNIYRPPFYFTKNTANVLTQHANRNQIHPGKKQNNRGQRGKTLNRITVQQMLNNGEKTIRKGKQ
tara:strand:+ start:80497 stop:80700 length:204 start_codon:yes stop_codon:yes gene_type:complete